MREDLLPHFPIELNPISVILRRRITSPPATNRWRKAGPGKRVGTSALAGVPGTAVKTMKEYEKRVGSETILLVDDDRLVCDLTKRILERSGYTVIVAADGKEALNSYENGRDRISLVILDVIMPRMGGTQCVERLRQIDPDVKILLTSGYFESSVEKTAAELGAKGFVYKPYSTQEMLTAVRVILDSD